MGDFKKWEDPNNVGMILKWGRGGGCDTPISTMNTVHTLCKICSN